MDSETHTTLTLKATKYLFKNISASPGFFHLLPSLTTDYNVICKHHHSQRFLPDLIWLIFHPVLLHLEAIFHSYSAPHHMSSGPTAFPFFIFFTAFPHFIFTNLPSSSSTGSTSSTLLSLIVFIHQQYSFHL